MALPCNHRGEITDQVKPTIELLNNLDELHPEVLTQHSIKPKDYKDGLVFRSAIESIRGTFIASSTTGREGLVRDILENLKQHTQIAGYQQSSSRKRYDFTVSLNNPSDYNIALEVKGGEGNSINISERPLWAKEFYVWSHLDGAIVNQPSKGARSVINRIANELVRRNKQVDALFFKDILCGTRARPCPKYPGQESTIGLKAAPDIFLLPQQIPTVNNPNPPVHNLNSLKFPKLILDLFGVKASDQLNHFWEVNIELIKLDNGNLRRIVQVFHQGKIVSESQSRAWQPEE